MDDDETPITLQEASQRFFAGRVKVPGLRRERDRGTLRTVFVANKEFTTPAAIRDMLKACEARRAGEAPPAPPEPPRSADLTAMDLAIARLREADKGKQAARRKDEAREAIKTKHGK